VSRKAELKKIKKQKEPDELENLFSQFDEQLRACENKIGALKKTITEIEMKKASDDQAEEAIEESTPPPATSPA
jgi:prefoldin subunit 5